MNRLLPLLILTGSMLAGCNNPMNMTYDFSRSYYGSFQAQSNLSRPSVAAAQYQLGGIEGTEIRLRLRETSTDAEAENITLQLQ
ncbi:MAG: hypothetical protein ACI9MC_000070 [Kiritimatiellia bacterium]|jgi:hypothetical protein